MHYFWLFKNKTYFISGVRRFLREWSNLCLLGAAYMSVVMTKQ